MLKSCHFDARGSFTARLIKGQGAFTLLELLLVIAIVLILASMVLPAIAHAKSRVRRVNCASNLGQLSLALAMYADDSDDEFPPRGSTTNWITLLQPYYADAKVLQCPADELAVTRTYIMNGFNDWFDAHLDGLDFLDYMDWNWPHGIVKSAIPEPADTVAFGEKLSTSGHIHADLLQGNGNDLDEIDHTRHPRSGSRGGSNFAFVDGSVRFLGYWKSVSPINLWALTPHWRSASLPEP